MPIRTNWNDPTSVDIVSGALAIINELHFDFARKNINIGYVVYRRPAEYVAGRQPLSRGYLEFTDQQVVPVYGDAPIITPGVEAVYSGVFDGEGVQTGTILISAAIPPVYGQEPIILPGKPSSVQILTNNNKLYTALAASTYSIMSGQFHIFENARFVQPSGFIV
jgi:hypothetical protein